MPLKRPLHCLIHNQVVQLRLTAHEVQPLGPQTCTCPPKRRRRVRTRSCCAIIPASETPVVQHSLCPCPTAFGAVLGPALWPTLLLKRESCTGVLQRQVLLIFDYNTLGLGEVQLSFKLSNLFPGSSQGYACASPYLPPFLDLLGFVSLSYLVFLPDFPRRESSPFWSPCLPLLHMPHNRRVSRCSILASTVHASAEELSPHCLSVSPL